MKLNPRDRSECAISPAVKSVDEDVAMNFSSMELPKVLDLDGLGLDLELVESPSPSNHKAGRRGLVAKAAVAVAIGSTLPLAAPYAGEASAASLPPVAEGQSVSDSVSSEEAGSGSAPVAPVPAFEDSARVRFVEQREQDSRAISDSTCRDSACKGLEFIDAKLPEIQQRVRDIREQMQVFQSEHTAKNLQTHRALLADRAAEVAREKVSIGKQLSDAELQILRLQTQLAMQPYEANFAADLLILDVSYQNGFEKLKDIDRQIAEVFSQPELNQTQLELLYEQHRRAASQLHYLSQEVLTRFIDVSRVQSSNPLWQDALYEELLQQLMVNTYQLQVLTQRQSTITQIESLLQEERAELASLLTEYEGLRQELKAQTSALEEYSQRRQALQAELANNEASSSELPAAAFASSADRSQQALANISKGTQGEVALALLICAGILTAFMRSQGTARNYQNYQRSLLSAEPHEDRPQFATHESARSRAGEQLNAVFSMGAMGGAIAAVLKAFRLPQLRRSGLAAQMSSYFDGLSQAQVDLPDSDVAVMTDDAIELALNGLDFGTQDEPERGFLRPEEIARFFEVEEAREYVAA